MAFWIGVLIAMFGMIHCGQGAVIPPPPPGGDLVLLSMGQSNNGASNVGVVGLPSDVTFQPRVFYSATRNACVKHGIPLQAISTNEGGTGSIRMGPQLYMGKIVDDFLLAEGLDRRLVILEFTKGGTSLAGSWLAGSNWLDVAITFFKAELDNYPRPYTVIGAQWDQGEADGMNATQTANYESNLEIMHARLLSEFPTLGWLGQRQLLTEQTAVTFVAGIRSAKTSFSSGGAPARSLFDLSGSPGMIQGDNLHLTQDGLIASGTAYGNDFLAISP